MLRPISTMQDINADALLAAVALRDQSLSSTKIGEIKLSSAHRQTVLIDDNPIPQSLEVIAEYLGAPKSFLAQADLPLAQHIVDHQFKKVKEERELVFKHDKAIGSQPTGNLRINGLSVVERMVKAVGEVRRANFYDFGDYVDVTIVGDKVTMKPKVNDITEGGIRCLYSELLTRQPSIEPYVERLVCLNGMICKDYLDVIKFESMAQFIEQFEDSIMKASKYLDTTIRAQLQKAAETQIGHSDQALRQIFESNKLNTRLLPSTLAALTVEEDGTAFGVVQAITRAANAAPYSHRVTMQEVGAKEMARLETVHCPTCWSSLVH